MKRLARLTPLLCLLFLPSLSPAAEEIPIGLLAPLTGFAAADGASVKNSVDLAVEKVNGTGGLLGRKVRLVAYDDRADAKEAVALARKLIQQDRVVGAVGGSYSMPTRAVAPIFQDEKTPLVAAYAIHPEVTQAGEFVFRNGFLGAVEGRAAAYTAIELLKAKRIALLTSDDAIYDRYRLYAASRIRKNFRKSSLLSGIYAAISRPESDFHPLGRAVLCVDDDPEVLEFMRRCLEEEGFSVKLCSDGDQALACAATQEYGVVLLDIAMPGLDGIEVCRRIKANPDLKGVKVFFVTAVDLDSFSREYQSSGADGILQKPFAANELLHLVSTNLAAGTDV